MSGAELKGIGDHGENLSIMIPNYNGSRYIKETLKSLQEEGDAVKKAQIEVIDNCSTDESEAAVQSVWGDRVKFSRNATNIGGHANFNACLEKAERDWIHILHSDDYVLPGIYKEFNRCLTSVPDAAAVFARSVIVDQDCRWQDLFGILGPEIRGPLKYDCYMWNHCLVPYVSVLIGQKAIEKVGTFDISIATCDWNLWWRIAKNCKVAYSNVCVGAYRTHSESGTSQLSKSAQVMIDSLKQLDIQARAEFGTRRLSASETVKLYQYALYQTLHQCNACLDDDEAFKNNFNVLKQFPRGVLTLRQLVKLRLNYYRHKINRKRQREGCQKI